MIRLATNSAGLKANSVIGLGPLKIVRLQKAFDGLMAVYERTFDQEVAS